MSTKSFDQITAKELAGLNTDLHQKLSKGSMSFEQIRWFVNLPFKKREELKNGGKEMAPPAQPSGSTNLKLIQTGIAIPALTEQFDPQAAFAQKGYWLGDNFKKYLLNTTQSFGNLPEAVVDKSVLKRNTTDKDIMADIAVSEAEGLLSKEEILWRMHWLTQQQPNGKAGVLVNNGYATIIGYFMCSDGIVRVAYATWNSDDSEWHCSVNGLDYWREGTEVLSRNGVLNP